MYAGRAASLFVFVALSAMASYGAILSSHPAQPFMPGAHAPAASGLRLPPSPLPASITLVGSIVDMPGGVADLTFHVGGGVVNQSANNGDYQATIAGTGANTPVWVEARASNVYYESLLGSYGRLASLAGADGILTTAELDRLRISPVSTALSFFIRHQLGGNVPASDSQLDRASKSIVGDDVTIAATVLHEFATGGLTLPLGYQSGYAFLQDRDAYADFLVANPALATDAVPAYMAVSPAIAITPLQLGPHMLMSGPVPFNDPVMTEPGTLLLSKTGATFDIYGDSAGTLSQTSSTYTPTFSPSGDLQLVPTHEAFYDQFLNPSVLQRSTIKNIVFRKLFAANNSALWVELMAIHLSYPSNPEIAESDATVTRTWSVSDLDRVATRLSQDDVQGLRALPVFCLQGSPASLTICEYALHRFGSLGQGGTEDVGLKIDGSMAPATGTPGSPYVWAADLAHRPTAPGPNPLQIADDTADTTYWKLLSPDAATVSLVYVAHATQAGDAYAIAGRTVMINANKPAGFDQVSPLGTWRFATFDSVVTPYGYAPDYAPVTVRFIRASDGTELQKQVRTDNPDDQTYAVTTHLGWRLVNGRMYDTRYRADVPAYGGGGFSSCALAYESGATKCAPWKVRYFHPLAAVGARLYGIEDLYVKSYVDDYDPPFDFIRYSRPTFYEKVAP